MYFSIEDDEKNTIYVILFIILSILYNNIIGKYNTSWDKASPNTKIEFDSEPSTLKNF